MKKIFLLTIFLLIPYKVFASDVHITEVLFNPAGADTGGEYVVIKNEGAEAKNLAGWQLYPDGIGYFTFPLFSLEAGASVKVFLRQSGSNSSTALYHQTPAANMGNTSGSIALFSGTQHDASTLVDFVQYGRSGETWETSADEAGLWIKGEFIAINMEEEGVVLRRTGDSHTLSVWQTGDAEADNDTVSQEQSVPDSAEGGGSVSSGPTFTPKIRAFAGSDKTSIAGAEVLFTGRSLDAEDQLLESQLVRYVWNFGDGNFADGKNVAHTYAYPGVYTATLIVTQGQEMLQDDCLVKVGDNTVLMSEVVPGVDGWVELSNAASLPVDIGKWYLEDAAGARFIFPPGTRIAAGGFAVFANSTTKLVATSPLVLRYQDGKEADRFAYTGSIPAGLSASRKDGVITMGERTPGALGDVKKPKPKSIAESTKGLSIPKSAAVPVPAVATTTLVADVQAKKTSQALVLHPSSIPVAQEMRWLLASIVAGLLLGGVFTFAVRVRRPQP